MDVKNNFTSYNFRKASNIHQFVEKSLEELRDDTHNIQNYGINNYSYEYDDQEKQCFDIPKIKIEPSFDFEDVASSTRMSFSPSDSVNMNEETQHGSVANSLNKNRDGKENHPPIWEYEMESTLDTKNSNISDKQITSPINKGNTNRLLGLFDASHLDYNRSKNNKSNQNQENVKNNDSKTINEAKQQNMCNPKKIEKNDFFQLGRQKGIRDILTSIVSPISTPNMSSLGSPDLTLSYLQRENMMLLNKLAENPESLTKSSFTENSGFLTKSCFEDTSNVYAANISKEESRVNIHTDYKESKFKRVDEKIEIEGSIKIWLKPFWNTDIINKDDYKNIMLKCVRKISCWKEAERTSVNIRRLVEFYIKRIRHENKKDKTFKSARSCKNNFSSEKNLSKNKMSDAESLLNVSNNRIISQVKKNCSGKGSNIEITIKRSCCKKSNKNNSHKIVISDRKSVV